MKVRITHKDIMSMVSEVIGRLGNRDILSEIRAVDAYNRFYQGKIEPEVYQTLMSGTENMTPFHKIALGFCVNEVNSPVLNSYGISIPQFAKMIGDLWNKVGEEGHQFLVKACNDDKEMATSFSVFYYLLNQAVKMKSFTEKQYRSGGYEVLFRNEKVSVTCTKTYSSSSHYFGRSHWCTASDQFGNYDGYEMFREYTIECWDGAGFLVQFCTDSGSYQMQYILKDNGELKDGQLCNWEDTCVGLGELENTLEENGVSYADILNNYIKPNAERLADETKELADDEQVYYTRKRAVRLRTAFGGIDAGIEGKEAEEFARYAAVEAQVRRFEDDNRLYTAWVTHKDNGFTQVTLRYNGKNELEKDMINKYSEDYDDSFTDRFGRLPNNYAIFVFKNGQLYKKWRGEISTSIERVMFITEGYNEELYDVELLAVVDVNTYETVVDHPFTFVALEDNRWFLEQNIESFLESYNSEKDVMADEDDIDYNDWFFYQQTREDYQNRIYIAMNMISFEQVRFKV